jgi:predicted acylesterase/phospholipase RssA
MFRSIALGGGGIRGVLHIGALRALQEKQPLVFPDGIYGCSVGSIIAAALAFGITLEQFDTMLFGEFILSNFVPPMSLAAAMSFQSKKGMFSMDLLEETLIRAFGRAGIDIRNKVIADAPTKLWILASNLTTRKSTLLTGQVPLLAAIKASCCIPFVYHPQVIYNQVFLDGGVSCDCIVSVVPKETLVLHIGYSQASLVPSVVADMPIGDFFRNVYASVREGVRPLYPNVIVFDEPKLGPLSDVTEEEKQYMLKTGYDQASRFLAKVPSQEPVQGGLGDDLSKVGDSA